MRQFIRIVLAIVSLALFCVSGYKAYEIYQETAQEKRVKQSLLEYRPVITPGLIDEIIDIGNPFITDLSTDVNTDIVGWLTIPGTRVDYPFVYSEDYDYYLKHDVYGNATSSGSLFMDERSAADFSGEYTIIYGHNMNNKSMFGDLSLFSNESFFDSHTGGTVFLDDHTYSLEFFAYMIVYDNDRAVYGIPRQADFFEYVKSTARIYREPSGAGKIVALSTCTNIDNDTRIVLMGVCR